MIGKLYVTDETFATFFTFERFFVISGVGKIVFLPVARPFQVLLFAADFANKNYFHVRIIERFQDIQSR